MRSGPIMPNILRFAIPIMLSQALQLLFNAADMVVLGQCAENSDNCLAAVGSTFAAPAAVTNYEHTSKIDWFILFLFILHKSQDS